MWSCCSWCENSWQCCRKRYRGTCNGSSFLSTSPALESRKRCWCKDDWLRVVGICYLKVILWAETNKGCEVSVISTRVLKQEVDHQGWLIWKMKVCISRMNSREERVRREGRKITWRTEGKDNWRERKGNGRISLLITFLETVIKHLTELVVGFSLACSLRKQSIEDLPLGSLPPSSSINTYRGLLLLKNAWP